MRLTSLTVYRFALLLLAAPVAAQSAPPGGVELSNEELAAIVRTGLATYCLFRTV